MAELDAKMAVVEAEIKEVKAKIAVVEAELMVEHPDRAALQGRLTALQGCLTALQGRLTAHCEEVLLMKQAQAAAAAQPQPATEERYRPPALSFSKFEKRGFLARLKSPVLLLPHDARRCSLEHIPKSLASVVQVGNTTYHDLSDIVKVLCKNKKSGTLAEDALHARDDAILELISTVSGMKIERNCRSSSTTEGARLDAWIGQPPAVMIEEKIDASALDQAMSEVHMKLKWIPHYEHVDFVFGIAIAGDLVKMEAIGRHRSIFSDVFKLQDLEGCIGVVQAAINIGRVCKHILDKSLAHPITIPFYSTIVRQRCCIRITHTHVTKTYFTGSMDTAAQERLKAFYDATKRVEFLERATATNVNKKGELEVTLQPVGLVRRPSSVQEAKVAMRCVLTAMAGCSGQGWVLNDVRWQNIIKVETGFWYIIDCEFARRTGDPIPSEPLVKCDWASHCGPSTDLYMAGRLLKELGNKLDLDTELEELQRLLISKRKCWDKQLTAAEVLNRFSWLLEASPCGSPSQGVSGVELAGASRKKRSAAQSGTAGPPAQRQKVEKHKAATKQE